MYIVILTMYIALYIVYYITIVHQSRCARATSENPSRDMLERRARFRVTMCYSDEQECESSYARAACENPSRDMLERRARI